MTSCALSSRTSDLVSDVTVVPKAPPANDPADARHAAGVYVLTNDAMHAWTKSFIASFRRYNPSLPLCLIPFDHSFRRVAALVEAAGGTVLDRPDDFRRLDIMGETLEMGFTPYGKHWFRRFAAFDGPFDRFMYLDTRVVVLGPLQPIIDEVAAGVCDLVHFDRMINEVYCEGPIRRQFVLAGGGRGFNSGMWASRAGLFTMDQMERATTTLAQCRDQMNPRNTDQFFLNFLCDDHAVPVAHFGDLHADYTHACWAGDGGAIYEDAAGAWRRWKFRSAEHRTKVPFVHWAGFRLSPSMPHYHLFARFQTSRYGVLPRMCDWLRGLPGRCFAALRGNRHLNTLYHRLRHAA
jgi:hypothetical protein